MLQRGSPMPQTGDPMPWTGRAASSVQFGSSQFQGPRQSGETDPQLAMGLLRPCVWSFIPSSPEPPFGSSAAP